MYELSNFDHMLGVKSQSRVSCGNRIHDPHTNTLAHYPLDYQANVIHIKFIPALKNAIDIDYLSVRPTDQFFLQL